MIYVNQQNKTKHIGIIISNSNNKNLSHLMLSILQLNESSKIQTISFNHHVYELDARETAEAPKNGDTALYTMWPQDTWRSNE